ncbi:MAG: ABC transporter permease, partial [Actinobacteria bacterium]|nr:ABC transporter permease [Actinomycetota bacterium]
MTTSVLPQAATPMKRSKLRRSVSDSLVVTERNLVAYLRIPDQLFFSSVQPIMFVLLFRFVFGGAIATPGMSYVNFLMAGIFVQTVLFGSVSTSVGLAEDLQKGLIERFRSLPMARSAVLFGRTIADSVRNVFVMILITLVGFAVGFRIGTSFGLYLVAFALLILFAFSFSWIFAYIGLSASNSETAQLMAFPILFPLTFASTAFVPASSMPPWLRWFAEHQPVSITVNATRALMQGGPGANTAHWVILTLIWSAIFMA